MTIKSDLQAARDLIADREHWTFGDYAIENTGATVAFNDPNACAFCAQGALARVTNVKIRRDDGGWRNVARYERAHHYMIEAGHQLFGASYVAVNDGEAGLPADAPDNADYAIMHENILRVFDRAIALAGGDA